MTCENVIDKLSDIKHTHWMTMERDLRNMVYSGINSILISNVYRNMATPVENVLGTRRFPFNIHSLNPSLHNFETAYENILSI